VTESTLVMLNLFPFCSSTVQRMVFCALKMWQPVNELPIGPFSMSVQDLSSEKHGGEEQNGCRYPARGVPEFRLE